jgi:hypothetical protein
MEEVKVNNWKFAEQLDQYKSRELDPLVKEVDAAFKIMSDINYKWADEEQKKNAQAKYDRIFARLQFIKGFLEGGIEIVRQHEDLVTLLSKLYDTWYSEVSNDGKQETDLMEGQALKINEIFTELFNALKPLGLEGVKAPKENNI